MIKRLTLRRDDTCSACLAILFAGTTAWWDNGTRKVTCEQCHDSTNKESHLESLPDTEDESVPSVAQTIEAGIAGHSAMEEYLRRHDKREARIDAKFGRFAGVIKFLTDDPQSVTAWRKGSVGERKLAASLNETLGDRAILLHDRRVPRTKGNIDHLVVAGSGVWVVDAKNYSGLVQLRDVGGFFKVDKRLYVGGRDRTKVIDGLDWQVNAVTKALAGRDVPVRGAICFTDAEWGWFAKPFALRGTFVSGPNGLARKISETSSLNAEEIQEVAVHLSTALPAKS